MEREGRGGEEKKAREKEGRGREWRVKTCCPMSNKLSPPMRVGNVITITTLLDFSCFDFELLATTKESGKDRN